MIDFQCVKNNRKVIRIVTDCSFFIFNVTQPFRLISTAVIVEYNLIVFTIIV